MPSDKLRLRREAFDRVDLYPVITEAFCQGRSSLEVLEAVLEAGVDIVQLREKELTKRELFKRAVVFRQRTARAGALLIINDHLDVALAVDADGVHLGQSDLPIQAARGLAPNTLIGLSTHNKEQVREAVAGGADYVNVGPIFSTGTKPEHKVFLGTEELARMAPDIHIPFTVMGGIKLDNVDRVVAAGARRIAVVTAVTAQKDVRAAAAALREKINSNQ